MAHNCHDNSKTLASKAKCSLQKQHNRVKSKLYWHQKLNIHVKANCICIKAKQSRQKQIVLASKVKQLRQKQIVLQIVLASKAEQLRQKQNNRVKGQTLASKLRKYSEANASLCLFCSSAYGDRIHLNIFDIFV